MRFFGPHRHPFAYISSPPVDILPPAPGCGFDPDQHEQGRFGQHNVFLTYVRYPAPGTVRVPLDCPARVSATERPARSPRGRGRRQAGRTVLATGGRRWPRAVGRQRGEGFFQPRRRRTGATWIRSLSAGDDLRAKWARNQETGIELTAVMAPAGRCADNIFVAP